MSRRLSPPSGKVADPAWRAERSRKAVGARVAKAAERRAERGKRYRSRADAYTAGYRAGYARAYAYWRHRFKRAMQEAA